MDRLKKRALALGATDLMKSTRKNKKWMVKYNNKLIHFGDLRYQDFTQHKNLNRKKSYLKRAKGIRDKQGNLTYNNKNKSNFWAIRILWT